MWNLKKKNSEKEIRFLVTKDGGEREGELKEDGQKYKLIVVR